MVRPSLRTRDGGWDVVLDSGAVPVDAVVVTTPSPVLARLVPDLPEPYREKLSGLEYEAAVVALLQLTRPLSDIYWLNVADDDLPFTGVIEHTNFISPGAVRREAVRLPLEVPGAGPSLLLDAGR